MKIADVGEDRYEILLVIPGVGGESEELKRLYGGDSILQNNNQFYVCNKLIDVEFEMVGQKERLARIKKIDTSWYQAREKYRKELAELQLEESRILK